MPEPATGYRVLVTGSRDWDNLALLSFLIGVAIGESGRPKAEVVIVHGACPTGADTMAEQTAVTSDVMTEPHPADWDRHDKAAGPIRNQEMVDLGADICLAFFKVGAGNRGTANCAASAERAGIPVRRILG